MGKVSRTGPGYARGHTLQRKTAMIDPNRDQLTSTLWFHSNTTPAARVTTHLALSFMKFKIDRVLFSALLVFLGSERMHRVLCGDLDEFTSQLGASLPVLPCKEGLKLCFGQN